MAMSPEEVNAFSNKLTKSQRVLATFSPRLHANDHRTDPAYALVSSTTSSRSLAHHPNTIQFA